MLARAYTAIQKYDLGLRRIGAGTSRSTPAILRCWVARAAVLLWTGRIEESIAAAELAMRLNVNIGPEASLNLGLAIS